MENYGCCKVEVAHLWKVNKKSTGFSYIVFIDDDSLQKVCDSYSLNLVITQKNKG